MNLTAFSNVIVHPNARKNAITRYTKDTLFVDIKAPAENGKANDELITYLTKLTGRQMRILRGRTSKRKTIRFL